MRLFTVGGSSEDAKVNVSPTRRPASLSMLINGPAIRRLSVSSAKAGNFLNKIFRSPASFHCTHEFALHCIVTGASETITVRFGGSNRNTVFFSVNEAHSTYRKVMQF